MSDISYPRSRQVPHAAAKRRAMDVARPFLQLFEDWNHRAAKCSAIILSQFASSDEKARQQELLAVLLAEVETGYAEYRAAITDELPHDRLTDLTNAFERLLGMLRRL